MRRSIWALTLLCGLFIAGCRIHDGVLTHRFVQDSVCLGNDLPDYNIMADLEGKEDELQVISGTSDKDTHWMIVRDRYGKVISQINTGKKVRGMASLADPRDNTRWLFYSINDQRRVALNGIRYEWNIPLQRHEKMFESLGREHTDPRVMDREWYALIYPVLLRDINADGRYELVCFAYDGFTADPRGIVVYDFDTGKIKWKFETSTNMASLLVGDYDGNGSSEIIVSTLAQKNSPDIRNQMDDMNCWIAVLDVSGNLLYHQLYTEGYSSLQLVEADTDQDGRKEIYGVTHTWGARNIKNSVSILQWDGKRIKKKKTWALSSSFERSLDGVILNDMDGSGKWRLLLNDNVRGLTVLDADLKPVKHGFKGFVKDILDVDDINKDGHKEVLLRNENGEYVILDDDLQVRARLGNPLPEEKSQAGFLVSTGYNTPGRIAISGGAHTKYYNYERIPLPTLIYSILKNYSGIVALLLLLGCVLMGIRNRARLRKMKSISDALGTGLLEVNRTGKVIYINSYATGLLPMPPGTASRIRLSQSVPELWKKVLGMGHSRRDHFEMEITPPGKLEAIHHRVWVMEIGNIFKKYHISLIPTHQPVADLEDKLAWADSARRLSHHVRRHITNIVLALSELEQQTPQEDPATPNLQIIREEIEKVRVFTHSFQRFSELENYSLKLQDMVPSVEHSLAHIVLPEGVKLIKNWDLKSVAAFIEPIRFEEAITNVVNNAVEAMPSGGTLHITVKEFPAGHSPQGELNVLVEVEDSGKGIPEKYMEEVWKPFFTTNQSGTGIGIPESRKIIQSMGGKMMIQSEEGVGTVVSFWLKGSPHE